MQRRMRDKEEGCMVFLSVYLLLLVSFRRWNPIFFLGGFRKLPSRSSEPLRPCLERRISKGIVKDWHSYGKEYCMRLERRNTALHSIGKEGICPQNVGIKESSPS